MRFKIDKKMLGMRLKEAPQIYEKLKAIIFKAFADIPPPEVKRTYRDQVSKIEVCSDEDSEEEKMEEKEVERH